MWADRARWQGVALIAIAIVATLWLAATGQLVLYIHPRYVLFTVVMAAIGLALVLANFTVTRTAHDHDEHADDVPTPRHSRPGRLASSAGAVLALAAAASLLVLPPATLSAATAAQRDIGGAGATANTQSLDAASSASDESFAAFTVQDWSSLLRQTSDLGFYTGKPADVAGFITEDPESPDDTFWVSRFVVTCCAVDAQPVGVPVHLDDWRETLGVDQWVRVTGQFATNPSSDSSQAIALLPGDIEPIEQPTEPYLF